MNPSLKEAYASHLLSNYAAPPIALERGEGVWAWDSEGKRYLDFCSGIAVNALGHCHPRWVEAISRQCATLGHCSNLYGIPGQAELARRLSRYTPGGALLFCNSGAEANEALLKLARLHGREKAGREGVCYRVVAAENAFHGRTFGGMAATPQEKVQGGFRPMLDGIDLARLNDIDSFAMAIGEHTAAVFVESIQGEGGVFPADPGFLAELRQLCTDRGVLLMVDEVQCGIGRSGAFFAYEAAGIEPDAIGMAKGLGGGFPIGAIWVRNPFRHLFQPGSHGTTFGGSPLACAAALAVLDVIEEDNLVERVRSLSGPWHQRLQSWPERFPKLVREVRGRGFMVGIGLQVEPGPLVAAARGAGLLVPPAGRQTIRLLPPLTATSEDLSNATAILERIFDKAGTTPPL